MKVKLERTERWNEKKTMGRRERGTGRKGFAGEENRTVREKRGRWRNRGRERRWKSRTRRRLGRTGNLTLCLLGLVAPWLVGSELPDQGSDP